MKRWNYNRIKIAIAEKSKSNKELAKYLQVRVQTVSSWCTNRSQPDVQTLYRVAEFLGVEVRELLTDRNNLKEL